MQIATLSQHQKVQIVNIVRSVISSKSEQKLANLRDFFESKYSFTVPSDDEFDCFVKEVAISKQSITKYLYSLVCEAMLGGAMLKMVYRDSNIMSKIIVSIPLIIVAIETWSTVLELDNSILGSTSNEFDAAISECFKKQFDINNFGDFCGTVDNPEVLGDQFCGISYGLV